MFKKLVYLVLLFGLSGGWVFAQLQTRTTAPYLIQTSDQLELSYVYTPDFDETLTIQGDGSTTIKLIGNIVLGGLTVDQAKANILSVLKTKLNDPEITLNLSKFVRPSFIVAGQVISPGKFEMRGKVSAIDAVAMAGGLKDNAKHSQVILFRKTDSDLAKTRLINLKRLMDPNHPHLEEDVELQPGDLLVVPKNVVGKIADYIKWLSIGGSFKY